MSFAREWPSTIDPKGRTSIPAKFREILVATYGDERFVITKATPVDFGGELGRGLSVYPISEWREIERKINANEGGFPLAQLNSIKRRYLGAADEYTTDKLGRVLVPTALREHAALDRDIIFVGMGNRFDIWSRDTYLRVSEQDEKALPLDSEELASLGI
ncbi:division/cell wall cluster transcriptional repressor MraZ [Geobacter pelophilus]|uniref:Transcriptional regulator MraZ n=1 Tax=Geoanaerobacter pelophilus TaxID=60036 RepID=A0AAW4KZK0_9BACT|nr:division/cell wall cluster transcriptional repressor MraZ [Geoanaerobacter pelophilus]MBT0663809.1 division/cell wall cluster transcriptional repressor MraZ [Geoanaerobacter pelophilus]